MGTTQDRPHASDSSEQRFGERAILDALQRKLGVQLSDRLPLGHRIELDGFQDGATPICVEVFAHQGDTKAGQRRKLMADMCKLLLVEKLTGRACRKIVAVSDEDALRFLDNSWQGRFADKFGIERVVVGIPDDTRGRIRRAQARQYR